jgi:hypothetical protein
MTRAAPAGRSRRAASTWCATLWSYNETDGVATLTAVRILCPACDHARHFARAGQLGQAAAALSTLARVNGISEAGARALQAKAGEVWERRSRLAWTVRVSESLLEQYPVLAALDGQHGVPGEGRTKVALADQQAHARTTQLP